MTSRLVAMATSAHSTTAQVGDGEPRNSEAGEWCFHAFPVPKEPRWAEGKRSKNSFGAARAPRWALEPTAHQPHVQRSTAPCHLHTAVPNPAGAAAHKGLLPSAFQLFFFPRKTRPRVCLQTAQRVGIALLRSLTPQTKPVETSWVPINAGASLG